MPTDLQMVCQFRFVRSYVHIKKELVLLEHVLILHLVCLGGPLATT